MRLSTVTLPGMDGLMLARAIKSDPRIAQASSDHLTHPGPARMTSKLSRVRRRMTTDEASETEVSFESLVEVIQSEEGPRAIMSGGWLRSMASRSPGWGGRVRTKTAAADRRGYPVNQKVALHQLLQNSGTARGL
jgi:hypothetical protein